ncbi:MAG: DUF1015 domain-containing protein [Actinobacteria bacterium]|nr:DUF1015 domain-containing protein [Actinomycetota bacterium]
MPTFEPFPGLRYTITHDLADVTAPPYDVITDQERAELLARHPDNAVGIDLPVADAAVAGTGATDEGGPASTDPYLDAAATFQRWQDDGVLRRDEPAFYVYRMDYVDELGAPRHTTGVMGALTLSRPGEGGILPHEQTTKKAKSDRLDLQRATRANLSAVWGLSPAEGLSALLDTGEAPLATWTDGDGVAHSLWVVTDAERLAGISTVVGSAAVVIADGHHRYETALAYRDEQRAARGEAAGGHDAVLMYVVELADDELNVQPIHRLLSGLPDDFDLIGALEPFFTVERGGGLDGLDSSMAAAMVERGALVLAQSGGWWFLTPRADAFSSVRDLDTVRFDHAIADLPEHTLVFQHGAHNAVARVRAGDAQAAALLRPATVAQIVDIANGGERMPPKTTFFYPKPRTGVVFRTLDE